MAVYYTRLCRRCGNPLNTSFIDIVECDACRIVAAQERVAAEARAREDARRYEIWWNSLSPSQRAAYTAKQEADLERIRNLPPAPMSVWEILEIIGKVIFYGFVAYYIAWPMLTAIFKIAGFFLGVFF